MYVYLVVHTRYYYTGYPEGSPKRKYGEIRRTAVSPNYHKHHEQQLLSARPGGTMKTSHMAPPIVKAPLEVLYTFYEEIKGYIHVFMHVCVSINVYLHTYTHTHTICIFMYIYRCKYIYMYTYIYIHTHTRAHTHNAVMCLDGSWCSS